ncbi:protein CYSTEINE-RICH TRANSMEMBRANE MODULE 11-like [Populus nigra]|uniref:protein CYSTEINE-RICH TRANSMEMBRANE MODULE 11-like n=1 Tax=Populus nigra TaxID=3691 RepID=UPI002B270965|nr:protein CYSTEINE-RICH TRANSMEMBRANE MODULE 11-like [Populus nigra]
MSYDNNNHQASAEVYPPKQEVLSPPVYHTCIPAMQGYYEAGPYVAPPPVSDPMKYGPEHLQQPPPPPERTSQRDDDFCTGCCCC